MSKPIPIELSTTYHLASIVAEIRSEHAYSQIGHAARTLVREDDLRIIVIAMRTGAVIPEHQANDTVSVQVLSGRVRLNLVDGQSRELTGTQLVALEGGARHAVEALDESSLLVTFGYRKHSAAAPATA